MTGVLQRAGDHVLDDAAGLVLSQAVVADLGRGEPEHEFVRGGVVSE